ncbi:MAG: hypothetical protein ACREPE_08890 [Lysobacter sp.]
MYSLASSLYDSLGIVAAALVAATLSYLGLIIAKENKISEFRQTWIDALRQDMADYISAVRLIAQSHLHYDKLPRPATDELEYTLKMHPAYLASSASLARIRLRLNPCDPDRTLRALNDTFLEQVETIQNLLQSEKYDDVLVLTNALHEHASPILQREWKRVKAGEPIYRNSKRFALVVLMALLVVFAWGVYGRNHPASASGTAVSSSCEPKPLHGWAQGDRES